FKQVIHKPDTAQKLKPLLIQPTYFLSTRGVTYSKGHYWYKNIYPLTKKTIRHDFAEMKDAGVNTVKIYGPNVYDHLTFEVAEEQDLKINYSFWIPSPGSFINDTGNLGDLEKTILKTVNKNKDNPGIVAWTFGNSTLQQLDQ